MTKTPLFNAIYRYTGEGYVQINGDCRGDAAGDLQVCTDIFQLDTALASSALTADQVVFRGIDGSFAKALEENGLEIGDIFVERGFLSTSRNQTVAKRFLGHEEGGLLLRIRISEGMRALDLTPYSRVPDEEEILLPRGTMLRVVGYDDDEDVLDVEVVDHG